MPIQALFTALNGLQVAQQLLDVTSQNMANAQTPGYTAKTLPISTNVAGTTVSVQAGQVTRSVNTFLQRDYWNQVSAGSYYDAQSTYLTDLQQISGKPGDAGSIASLFGTVSNDFSQLSTDPSSSITQQQTIVDAQNFTGAVNKMATYVQQQRNDIQTQVGETVQTINTSLSQIAQLNQQIAQATYAGRSTADLSDQRDQAIQQLATQMNISTYTRSDGVTVVQTATGQLLADTVAQNVAFTPTTIGAGSAYPATIGGIVVGSGVGAFDLAASSPGGKLGGLLNLRDQVLPQQQAQLDELSEQTANAFAAQGLKLFSDNTGSIPPNTPGSYVGFAQQLQVNPAVVANPGLLQQGTSGGPALAPGDNSLIMNVVNNTLNANQTFNTAGLGPGATVASSGLPSTATLANYATQLIAGQANLLSSTTAQQTSTDAYRNALQQQFTNATGVDLDTEMSKMVSIQQAYGASAQMVKTVQSIFTDLLQAIQ